jgi:hypothetical protein
MRLPWFGRSGPGETPPSDRAGTLEAETRKLAENIQALEAEIREGDRDRGLLLEAALALEPGGNPAVLTGRLFDLCQAPFELGTCYLALADYEADVLAFPFYFEGGKARKPRALKYSAFTGLTTRAIEARQRQYYPTLEAQKEAGASFTDAERITGLIPETWYGVPLGLGQGWEARPFGLLSYESFPKDAFPPGRRRILDALASLLALALKAQE